MSARGRWWCLIAFTALFAGCLSAGRAPDQGYKNFQTAAANAPSQGWAAYWLGSSVRAGQVDFVGPDAGDFGAALPGGGVVVTYSADAGAGQVALELHEYSVDAWAQAQSIGRSRVPANATSEPVVVASHSGTLYRSRRLDGSVDQLKLILDADGTTVVAVTNSSIPLTPGSDVNPLIDEQTFLAVLQHLRPYPQ